MSIPEIPAPGKLVIGLFMKEKKLLSPLSARLIERFGPLDLVSGWLRFDHTDYYETEFGSPLFRRFLIFRNLTPQDALPAIKRFTNTLEKIESEKGKRRVNIDPGFLLRERFVLASGKNFSHRIYIGDGIYADLTLIFRKGGFTALPWTYPDYASPLVLAFLAMARKKYVLDLGKGTAESIETIDSSPSDDAPKKDRKKI